MKTSGDLAMKYTVAICDDDAAQTEYLSRLVWRWADDRNLAAPVSVYNSAEAFAFSWCQTKCFDILLLDIQMKGQNGLDLARQVRQTDKHLQIIFITAFPDYIAEGYDVDAVHYLTKPVKEPKVFETLDKAVARLTKVCRTVLLPVNGETIRLAVDDILMIESFLHDQKITAVHDVYSVRSTITELEKQLGPGFARCHRSYLVNLGHVKKITRTEVFLDNGNLVPLSRRLYDSINMAFIHYFTSGGE
jgi:DNA-binding LytR/AlgR family response regulator